jgi:hypothetical protein
MGSNIATLWTRFVPGWVGTAVNLGSMRIGRSDMRALPGGEMVRRGLDDLERGVESTAALLVSIGSPRLRRLGFQVVDPFPDPEHRLYLRLAGERGLGAHSSYNALIRRLVSFERAAECSL